MLGNTIKDTIKNIQRSNLMSFTSVVSIIAALLVLGAIIIISININNVAANLEDSLQLKIFLNKDISEQEKEDLEIYLDEDQRVTGYYFQSSQETLDKYAERLEDYAGLLDGFSESNNPISESYTVQVTEPGVLEDIKIDIEDEGFTGINYVKYGDNYIDSIMLFSRFSNIVCLLVLGLLSAISIVIIYNTIKLTCYSNRKEIEIMQSIGAEGWYIKIPFFFEGLLLGILGAICATLILAVLYTYLLGISNTFAYLPLDTKLVSPGTVLIPILVFSSIYGIFIGAFGSLFSIRKYFYS